MWIDQFEATERIVDGQEVPSNKKSSLIMTLLSPAILGSLSPMSIEHFQIVDSIVPELLLGEKLCTLGPEIRRKTEAS